MINEQLLGQDSEFGLNLNDIKDTISHPDQVIMAVSANGKERVETIKDMKVTVSSTEDFFQFDMEFDKSNKEANLVWKGLEIFRDNLMKEDPDTQFGFFIYPDPSKKQFLFVCNNPVFWAMTSKDMNKPPESIRILFSEETCGIVEANNQAEEEYVNEDPDGLYEGLIDDSDEIYDNDYRGDNSNEDDFKFEPITPIFDNTDSADNEGKEE